MRNRCSPVLFLAMLAFCPLNLLATELPAESEISAHDRTHWAYQPVSRPSVPVIQDAAAWQYTPLDAFILAKLQAKKLAPQPEATRSVLLRRLSFDLTGLPPSPEELARFEQDKSPDAYERLVERLLASPQHGEHVAQQWLDLARFAETDGFEHDRVRPTAYQYRDWVIRAFNRDLPYDRFLAWQLAGDEIAPNDPDARIATMFCLSGPDMPDINAQDLRRHNLLNEIAGTVGSVTMGLQFGCAQCHDHKYDAISQGDFFRLRAFFDAAVTTKRDELVSTLDETRRNAKPSQFYLRGDVTRPAGEIQAAFPRVLNSKNAAVAASDAAAKSSGRRTALASWLASPDHPLTARVMVNRLWQQHFGRGLSNSLSDFGVLGDGPSHPELLDYLAAELIAHEWSLKHIQRLIVTSAVYRQRSGNSGAAPPEAYASYPRRRLTAEAIRDAMLLTSGQLNSQAGGPGVMPPLAPEIQSTLLPAQWKVSADPADHVRRSVYVFARRNLRYPQLEAFDRADANQSCAARHVSTTAPQALLMLNSEFSLAAARRLAGRALHASHGDVSTALDEVVRIAYARQPTDHDRQVLASFIESQTKLLADEKRAIAGLALPIPSAEGVSPHASAALVDLCLAVLNTSEFIYLD